MKKISLQYLINYQKLKSLTSKPEENGTPKIHTITDSSPKIPTNRNQYRSVPNALKENNYKSMTVTLQVTSQEYKWKEDIFREEKLRTFHFMRKFSKKKKGSQIERSKSMKVGPGEKAQSWMHTLLPFLQRTQVSCQYPHGGSHPYVPPVPGNPTPHWSLWGHQAVCGTCTYKQVSIHTYKYFIKYMKIKKKKIHWSVKFLNKYKRKDVLLILSSFTHKVKKIILLMEFIK